MMEHMFQPEFKSAHDKMMSLIPAGRVRLEDDMKVLAVFLAAKASDYITGAIIPVDGGILAK
jgi:NAD(P)-dependent dehydrogenase (short-subunit alcohol dehydrogenase family)